MVRRLWLLAFVVLSAGCVLASGCVPVTEPVGDVTIVDPDQNLVGTWEGNDTLTIAASTVNNNPKGLMKAVTGNKSADYPNTIWFFTTKLGDNKSYANIILPPKGGGPLSFDKEGEFAKWQTDTKNRRFCIFLYKIDTSTDKTTTTLTVDCGNVKEFNSLMTKARVKLNEAGSFPVTPDSLKSLTDNSDKIYDSTNKRTYTKKK